MIQSTITISTDILVPTATPAFDRLTKANEERIARIKKLVSQPFDNIKHPVPLYYQLKSNS